MSKPKMIFHIPKPISTNNSSASQIRPVKMLNSFKELGYEVEIISGRALERKKSIKEIKEKINNGIKYEFMYSESSTMATLLTESHHLPTHPFLDFNFFRFLKNEGIKIGLFYRDVQWNFDELYNINIFKKYFAKVFYYWDLYNYNKLLDVLYLPSLKMENYIPYNLSIVKKELPSGIENIKNQYKFSDKDKENLNIFYVGGIGNLYNLKKIVKVVSKIDFINFTICTRKNDWYKSKKNYEKYLNSNINIIHKSGKELISYYEKADILNLFVKPIKYWYFAMPYKLFEYLSVQKPIISVNNTASGEFVRNNDIGWTIDYEEEQLKKLLIRLHNNRELLQKKRNNMIIVAKKNFWINRAEKVINDLI